MAASDDRTHLQELFARIKVVIRKIPRGRVATYAQVAELAGIPNGGRIAAAALKTSSQAERLPWQRVIGKAGTFRGRIAIHDPVGAAMQRHLLNKERVEVTDKGLVALDIYGWLPAERSARTRAGSARVASPRQRPRSASTRRASSSRR